MVWLYIVLAIAAIAGVSFEFYARFLPAWTENKTKKLEDKETIRNELNYAIRGAKEYKYWGFQKLRQVVKDAHISKKLCRELDEIIDLANECSKWRYESYQVINAEVRAQSKLHTILDKAFLNVFHSGFEHVLGGADGSRSEEIYRAIYKGELTLEIAKESLLEGYRNARATVQDQSGEEKEFKFKDIIDGEDFYRFFKELLRLQERESIKSLRGTQAKFLEKAQVILEEVS